MLLDYLGLEAGNADYTDALKYANWKKDGSRVLVSFHCGVCKQRFGGSVPTALGADKEQVRRTALVILNWMLGLRVSMPERKLLPSTHVVKDKRIVCRSCGDFGG